MAASPPISLVQPEHQAVSILNADAVLKFQHRITAQKDGKPALNGSTSPPAPVY
jgi:hypothetical protein